MSGSGRTSDMSGIMTKVSLASAAASDPYARTTSDSRSPTMPTSRLGLACLGSGSVVSSQGQGEGEGEGEGEGQGQAWG